VKYGIDLPNMGGVGDPRLLAEIAREAEEAGWDGAFIFDSLYSPAWDAQFPNDPPKRATADPWIALAAMAMRTERVRLGTMITPLSRRRPWNVARETVTLDHLSNGRLVLPVGLGSVDDGGYASVGEVLDRKTRAELLDESLAILAGLWSGEPFAFEGRHYKLDEMTFLPKPVQSPRIPVWVVSAWPRRKSARRALRWDGILPVTMSEGAVYQADPARVGLAIAEEGAFAEPGPETLAEIAELARRERPNNAPFDIVVEGFSSGSRREQAAATVQRYADAGATWWIEGVWSWLFQPPQSVDRMRQRIRQGPPRVR
jgi:alkanesulfonate monooxygenase SsuD/methylene tetrahydromethanopterin reductase-like flavin-dependent oxidoreductase (luciferase family)